MIIKFRYSQININHFILRNYIVSTCDSEKELRDIQNI